MAILFLTFGEGENAGQLNQECFPSWKNFLSVRNNKLSFKKQKHSSTEANNLSGCLEKPHNKLAAHFDKTPKQNRLFSMFPQYCKKVLFTCL